MSAQKTEISFTNSGSIQKLSYRPPVFENYDIIETMEVRITSESSMLIVKDTIMLLFGKGLKFEASHAP